MPRRTLWQGDWLTSVRHGRSPHCDARPHDELVRLLVVHGISLPPGHFGGDAVLRLFLGTLDPHADPRFASLQGLKVSAHFFIRRSGQIWQCVGTDVRAWHAGQSNYRGRTHCNDFSIGIELEGCDNIPYQAAQYDALAWLARVLCRRYPITEIVGHQHIAPGRKTDPGPTFDWRRLQRRSRLPMHRFAQVLGRALG